MKISYILQFKDLSIMIGIGVILGILYGLLNISNAIKENIVTRIICDIIFVTTALFSFIFLVEKINFGTIRAYLLAGYLMGFALERITLGKIFAKGYKKVYNQIIIILKKLYNSKLGKTIFK